MDWNLKNVFPKILTLANSNSKKFLGYLLLLTCTFSDSFIHQMRKLGIYNVSIIFQPPTFEFLSASLQSFSFSSLKTFFLSSKIFFFFFFSRNSNSGNKSWFLDARCKLGNFRLQWNVQLQRQEFGTNSSLDLDRAWTQFWRLGLECSGSMA